MDEKRMDAELRTLIRELSVEELEAKIAPEKPKDCGEREIWNPQTQTCEPEMVALYGMRP